MRFHFFIYNISSRFTRNSKFSVRWSQQSRRDMVLSLRNGIGTHCPHPTQPGLSLATSASQWIKRYINLLRWYAVFARHAGRNPRLRFFVNHQGAPVPQARAALRRYKDVMQAAERIFDGEFACVTDGDDDVRMAPAFSPMSPSQTPCASVRTL